MNCTSHKIHVRVRVHVHVLSKLPRRIQLCAGATGYSYNTCKGLREHGVEDSEMGKRRGERSMVTCRRHFRPPPAVSYPSRHTSHQIKIQLGGFPKLILASTCILFYLSAMQDSYAQYDSDMEGFLRCHIWSVTSRCVCTVNVDYSTASMSPSASIDCLSSCQDLFSLYIDPPLRIHMIRLTGGKDGESGFYRSFLLGPLCGLTSPRRRFKQAVCVYS